MLKHIILIIAFKRKSILEHRKKRQLLDLFWNLHKGLSKKRQEKKEKRKKTTTSETDIIRYSLKTEYIVF